MFNVSWILSSGEPFAWLQKYSGPESEKSLLWAFRKCFISGCSCRVDLFFFLDKKSISWLFFFPMYFGSEPSRSHVPISLCLGSKIRWLPTKPNMEKKQNKTQLTVSYKRRKKLDVPLSQQLRLYSYDAVRAPPTSCTCSKGLWQVVFCYHYA